MEENIWKYGQYELDKSALLKYLQSNLDSYMDYNGYDENQKQQFRSAIGDISTGIMNGTITGNGYNNFIDSTNTIQKNDITSDAFGYIHTIANAMGQKFPKKEKKQPISVEQPVEKSLEEFDYNKHGLLYSFNKDNNPFGTDTDYSLWKSKYKSQEEINNALADHISRYKASLGEYEWGQIDKDHYNTMLSDLENDIRTNGIQDSDKLKLKALGFNPDSFILNVKKPEEKIKEEPKEEPKKENTDIEKVQSKFGNLPIKEYFNKFSELGLEESDWWRLTGLALDITSIIDPEPITAASLGYASDYLNYHADELDGINDSYWDDVLNVGLSTLGAVPILGDLGMSGKVVKNIGKASKSLGKLLLFPGIFAGVSNADELKQSLSNIVNNDFNVNDLRNAWIVLQLALGTYNSVKSGKAKTKADDIAKNAEEALVVSIKNKGKTKEYQFSGKDKDELLALKDKPDEFNNYLRKNFEGLEDATVASVKTTKGELDWKNREHFWSKPKRKERITSVITETKPVYETGQIPGKWNRARYFLNNTDNAIKPTRKVEPVEPVKPKKKTPVKKKKVKQKETKLPEVTTVEVSKTPTEVKLGQESERTITFDEARNSVSNESPKATEIKPDINSRIVSEPARIKSKVAKGSFEELAQRVQRSKLSGQDKAMARMNLDDLKNMARNNPNAAQEAQQVFQGLKRGSASYNQALNDLINTKMSLKDAKKILLDLKAFREGGIIKAQEGIKTGTPRNNKPWFSSIGKHFIEDLVQGLLENKYTYEDINKMQDRHYNLDKNLSGQVDKPQFNTDVKQYYTDINNTYKFVNDKGIKSGEESSRYRVLSNPNTGDSYNGGWIPDGYYSGRGQDRMLLGKRGDYTNEELENITNLLTKKGYALYTDENTKYYKLRPTTAKTIDLLDVVVTADDKSGTEHTGKEREKPIIDIPKPEKPKSPFINEDKMLATLNYFRTLKHNNKDYELANKVTPLLYDPVEHHRSIYGNLRAIMESNQAAGKILNIKPMTSDGSLQTASQLDAQNIAQQQILKGQQIDDEMLRTTSETAWQQEKENKENRYNIAMKNRENMHQVSIEKLQSLINKNRADYESGTNYINEWRTWLNAFQNERTEKDNYLYAKQLSNYIQNKPEEYIPNWKEVKGVWEKYKSGQELSNEEQSTIQQINEALSNAYYSELYGMGNYSGYDISRPSWQPILQRGGKITKDMVNSIIAYLKESNKNYNKDIDRSIRGLYNHIKLQRKK